MKKLLPPIFGVLLIANLVPKDAKIEKEANGTTTIVEKVDNSKLIEQIENCNAQIVSLQNQLSNLQLGIQKEEAEELISNALAEAKSKETFTKPQPEPQLDECEIYCVDGSTMKYSRKQAIAERRYIVGEDDELWQQDQNNFGNVYYNSSNNRRGRRFFSRGCGVFGCN